MIKSNFFEERFIGVFCPESNETILDFIYLLGYTDLTINTKQCKKDTLALIKVLLELDILEIYKWGKYEYLLKDIHFETNEILLLLERMWFEGIKYSDFYGIAIFGNTDWYVKKIRLEGLTYTTDWKTFVKEKIGNLEDWIQKNRPTESFNT